MIRSKGEIMKRLLLVTTLLLMGSSFVMAESIDEKMQRIREASPQKRVKLMNALKREIATMNKNERDATISALQTQNRSKQQVRQEVNNRVFEQAQEMQQTQGRSQQQAVTDFMKNRDETPMKSPR